MKGVRGLSHRELGCAVTCSCVRPQVVTKCWGRKRMVVEALGKGLVETQWQEQDIDRGLEDGVLENTMLRITLRTVFERTRR